MPPGLYIHIPFCASRCPYCDFAFVVGKTHLADRYADAVIQEFRARLSEVGSSPIFETIYFGGGTPSLVPVEALGRILDAVHIEAGIAEGAEITVEANPGDREKFAALRNLGVNRLSLGVQALDGHLLKALGRLHNADDAERAFEAARDAHFQNINLDLIFGVPKQSLKDWLATLNRAIELQPEHLSIYGLTIEPGTAFARRFERGRLSLPSESDQAAMYEAALDLLIDARYEQYEVSNFARPGFASRHNLAYWEGAPYLGIGASAHSFLNGRRSWNRRELMAYINSMESSGIALEGEEMLSDEARFLEQVMLGLRRPVGIPEILVANERTGRNLDRLLADHLLERAGDRLRLTRRGLLLADLVCMELVKES